MVVVVGVLGVIGVVVLGVVDQDQLANLSSAFFASYFVLLVWNMHGRSEELADCRHPLDPVEPAEEQPMDPVEPVEQPVDPIESQVSMANEEQTLQSSMVQRLYFLADLSLYGYFDSCWFFCAKFMFRLN